MNKVILMGNLTKDIELKKVNDKAVTQFAIGVRKRFSDGTDFINCVAWDKQAEFISKYFKKGQKIALVGRLQTRNWEDTNGQKKYATEVIVEESYFTSPKTSENETSDNLSDNTTNNMGEDDLPF